jgi:hypothetical protein
MGLFSRKPKAAPVPAAPQVVYHVGPPEPVKSPSGLISYHTDGEIKLTGNTVAEAKTILAELRLHKKVLAEQKREVAVREREIRADYTDKVRHQGSLAHGSGGFAQVIRSSQQSARRNSRAHMANALRPLEDRKRAIDAQVATTDRVMLNVEAWILKQAASPKTTP